MTNRRALIPLLALAVTALLLSGCGAPKSIRAYPGEQRPPGDVAVLTNEAGFGHLVTVQKIDGVPVERGRGRFEIEIPPGQHVIEVSYIGEGSHSIDNALVSFSAEPGARYEARAARLRGGFWSELGQEFRAQVWPVPAKGKWVAWVVDTRTGGVVGGKVPKQTLFSTTID